jgi:pyruvate dehydrogenase (quinone)
VAVLAISTLLYVLFDGLTACAGSCGPGSLHFINGPLRSQSQPCPGHPDRKPVRAQGLGLRIDPGGRLRRHVQRLQRLLRDDPDAGAGPPQNRRRLPGGADETGRRRPLPAGGCRQTPPRTTKLPYTVHGRRPIVRPSDADLDEIAALLNKSNAITIYVGAGRADAHDEVVATAARLKAPMAHTSRGKDFVEYDKPYNVGMTGMIGGPAGYHAVLDCDVLLLLGADFAWTQFYPDGATIIQIDADPTHIGRRHPVAIGAVGDIKPTLDALLPRLAQHDDNPFLTAHVERHQKAMDASPYRHRRQASTFGSLLHGTMADGMPSALGLQKCQPGRQVICLAGDGGFAMLLGDLLTTSQENLPIKIVVYDNGKLGFVDIEQKAADLAPVYTDLKNPDFGEVAKAVGLCGRFVSKAGELEDSVQTWLSQSGPALLHVKVTPMQLVTPPSPFVSPEAVVGMAVYSCQSNAAR